MSSSELDSSPLRMPADGASASRADEPRQNEGSSSSQGDSKRTLTVAAPKRSWEKIKGVRGNKKISTVIKAINTEIAVR